MTILDVDKFAAELPDETVSKIEEFANKLMTPKEIAVLIGIAPAIMSLMIQDDDNRVAIAYQRGKANRTLKLHEQELELADSGSAQAIQNLHGFLNQMNSAEE